MKAKIVSRLPQIKFIHCFDVRNTPDTMCKTKPGLIVVFCLAYRFIIIYTYRVDIYIYMLIPQVPCQLNLLHSAGNILASDPKGVCPASFLVERVISLLVAEPGSCAWWCAFGSTVGVCTGANELHGS